MKEEKLELVRGSGNVFRDFECENADVEQFKAILAAEIIKALDREGLDAQSASARTGLPAAHFGQVCSADLGAFTVDSLVTMLNRLGSRVEMKAKVRWPNPAMERLPA